MAREQRKELPALLQAAAQDLERAAMNLGLHARESSLAHSAYLATLWLLHRLLEGDETELRRMCGGPIRSRRLAHLVDECDGILDTGHLRPAGRPGWDLEVAKGKAGRREEAMAHALQFVPLIVPYTLPGAPPIVDTGEEDRWEQERQSRELAQRAVREMAANRRRGISLAIDGHAVVRKALMVFGMTFTAANNMVKPVVRPKGGTISKTSHPR